MIRFRQGSVLLACGGLALAATAAVAGNGIGGVFNLGKANTVNARTQLTGSTTSQQLYVTNASTSASSVGVLGVSKAGTGVQGQSPRIGVRAAATGSTGVNYGLYATTSSSNGLAGYFRNTSTTTNPQRGRGIRSLAARASPALFNPTDGAAGGEFAGPNGVIGVAAHPAGAGVVGRTAFEDGFAGYFQNSSTTTDPLKGAAVRGLAAGASESLFDPADGAAGGEFAGPNGLIGVASNSDGAGVVGRANAGRFGVFGSTTNVNGYGGFFQNRSAQNSNCTHGAGLRVLGRGATGNEIPGTVCAGAGEFSGQNGIVAVGDGIGVVALQGTGSLAIQAHGKVQILGDATVSGTLSKSAGTFRIDHPQDPANKYLSHSFVESPDMMNIYNGNVLTDAEGVAVVELPGYFEALNRDPRYQLTVIGSFADAQISQEISGNSFSIQTEEPGVKVSWQVTGIRRDAYAVAHPIVVEEEKTLAERGRYLHPVEHGQPAELATDAAHDSRQQAAALEPSPASATAAALD